MTYYAYSCVTGYDIRKIRDKRLAVNRFAYILYLDSLFAEARSNGLELQFFRFNRYLAVFKSFKALYPVL